jgi:hypothetical protein
MNGIAAYWCWPGRKKAEKVGSALCLAASLLTASVSAAHVVGGSVTPASASRSLR